eukprot:506539_1
MAEEPPAYEDAYAQPQQQQYAQPQQQQYAQPQQQQQQYGQPQQQYGQPQQQPVVYVQGPPPQQQNQYEQPQQQQMYEQQQPTQEPVYQEQPHYADDDAGDPTIDPNASKHAMADDEGYGVSDEYGERLEYAKPEYQDKLWAIIWLIHLGAMIILLLGSFSA